MKILVDTKTAPETAGTMAVSREVKAEYDGARLLRVILRGGDIDGDPDTEIDDALADQVKALGADRKCFYGRLRAVLVERIITEIDFGGADRGEHRNSQPVQLTADFVVPQKAPRAKRAAK